MYSNLIKYNCNFLFLEVIMNRFEKNEILNGAKSFLNEEQIEKLAALLESVEGATKETPTNDELS